MEIEQIAEKVNGLMANAHLHASDLYEIAYIILPTHAENKYLMPGITHMLTCKHTYMDVLNIAIEVGIDVHVLHTV